MRIFRLVGLAATVGCLALAMPAAATVQTYVFGGSVTSVALVGPTIATGQAVSGSFSVDTAAPLMLGSNASFANYAAITGFSITLGTYTATSTTGEIGIRNNAPDDILAVRGLGLTGAAINGLLPIYAILEIGDSTGAVFGPADGGLQTPFTFSTFDSVFDGVVSFASQTLGGEAGFTITGLQLVATTVPEPATLALFGIGLAGLAGLRGRIGMTSTTVAA